MLARPLILSLALFAGCASSQYVRRIETLTADEGGAQMTFGEVAIQIYTSNGTLCTIDQLEADGNDFQQGALDVFQGNDERPDAQTPLKPRLNI